MLRDLSLIGGVGRGGVDSQVTAKGGRLYVNRLAAGVLTRSSGRAQAEPIPRVPF